MHDVEHALLIYLYYMSTFFQGTPVMKNISDFGARAIILAVCFVALVISIIGSVVNLFTNATASWKSLVAYDQLINAACPKFWNTVFGVKKGDPAFGNEDETLSSVLGKLQYAGGGNRFARFVYESLDKLQENHCKTSIEEDEVLIKD